MAAEKKRKKKPEWLDFLFLVPRGICGKKQGFHINDDRVAILCRKREIRDDGLCSPFEIVLPSTNDLIDLFHLANL